MNPRIPVRSAPAAPCLNHPELGPFFFARVCFAGLLVLFLLATPLSSIDAQPSIAPEYNVKAGFLARFVQYTVWPEGVFSDPKSPIVIGVLGADPFGEVLAQTARDETAGRPLQVRHVTTIEEAETCQLVFISKAESEHEADWLAALARRPILTVGESGHTIDRGGILQFDIADDRVRFDANWAAMKAAGLQISTPMLNAARQVFHKPDSPL